jgi:hypothetical protein
MPLVLRRLSDGDLLRPAADKLQNRVVAVAIHASDEEKVHEVGFPRLEARAFNPESQHGNLVRLPNALTSKPLHRHGAVEFGCPALLRRLLKFRAGASDGVLAYQQTQDC